MLKAISVRSPPFLTLILTCSVTFHRNRLVQKTPRLVTALSAETHKKTNKLREKV